MPCLRWNQLGPTCRTVFDCPGEAGRDNTRCHHTASRHLGKNSTQLECVPIRPSLKHISRRQIFLNDKRGQIVGLVQRKRNVLTDTRLTNKHQAAFFLIRRQYVIPESTIFGSNQQRTHIQTGFQDCDFSDFLSVQHALPTGFGRQPPSKA